MGLQVISLFEINASQFISTINPLGVSHAHKLFFSLCVAYPLIII